MQPAFELLQFKWLLNQPEIIDNPLPDLLYIDVFIRHVRAGGIARADLYGREGHQRLVGGGG